VQHVVEVQRTWPEKLTQSPVKTNIWNFILFCQLVFHYWGGSRAVHRCVNFKLHRHMGSPLLTFWKHTFVRFVRAIGSTYWEIFPRTCQRVRYRKIEQWSETKNRKAVMIHALQRALGAWNRISQLQLQHPTFQNTMLFSSCKSQHTLTSDSWFEVVARHSQNRPAFPFHWLGCFASFAKRARYQRVKGYSHSSRCRWRTSGAHAHGR